MTPSEPSGQDPAPSTAPDPQLVTTLPDGRKVKTRLLKQRACNEKDAKSKLCAGHLKRWYAFGAEIAERFGKDAEVYRCENCKTVYLPNRDETPRSGTLAY
jgi:hypothetical protein